MKGIERFKAAVGDNIRESMGAVSTGGAGGPLPGTSRGVAGRYDGVTRPKDAFTIPVSRIDPDPDQPRREFDPDDLRRLADSLQARGQLQPIRVRFDAAREAWVIVSGERRWRAAGLAGLATLACVEAKGGASPEDILEDQLVENCVRSDLRPIEQANAFKTLMDRRGITGRQLAETLKLSPMSVSRALALLDLPSIVQDQVEQGTLSPSAAYEVGKLDDPEVQAEIARVATTEKLTRDQVAGVVQAIKARRPTSIRPEPVTLDVGDGTVVVKPKRGGASSAVQLLRKALRMMQEMEKGRSGDAA